MDQRIPERGRKMPIPQGKKRKKKEGKREGNKGRRNTRKNHMGSKNIEEKFNVKISYVTAWRITRKRLKIPYIKPYKIDKKRPIDADLGRGRKALLRRA